MLGLSDSACWQGTGCYSCSCARADTRAGAGPDGGGGGRERRGSVAGDGPCAAEGAGCAGAGARGPAAVRAVVCVRACLRLRFCPPSLCRRRAVFALPPSLPSLAPFFPCLGRTADEVMLSARLLRVRVEIMGSQKCRIVGKSQPVLVTISPIIFTRTRIHNVPAPRREALERLQLMAQQSRHVPALWQKYHLREISMATELLD
jgi:hypothetical protein